MDPSAFQICIHGMSNLFQAQRNELNAKVRMLREELQLLQEQGSYVGEVVKAMDKKKVNLFSTIML